MDFESYLDEAAKKNALTFRERITREIFKDWQKTQPHLAKLNGPEEMDKKQRDEIEKITAAVHAYALKHRIVTPFEAYETWGDENA